MEGIATRHADEGLMMAAGRRSLDVTTLYYYALSHLCAKRLAAATLCNLQARLQNALFIRCFSMMMPV